MGSHARASERVWYTPKETAEALGVSLSYVARLVRQGRLPAIRTGQRAWHLTAETVLGLAKQRAGSRR